MLDRKSHCATGLNDQYIFREPAYMLTYQRNICTHAHTSIAIRRTYDYCLLVLVGNDDDYFWAMLACFANTRQQFSFDLSTVQVCVFFWFNVRSFVQKGRKWNKIYKNSKKEKNYTIIKVVCFSGLVNERRFKRKVKI